MFIPKGKNGRKGRRGRKGKRGGKVNICKYYHVFYYSFSIITEITCFRLYVRTVCFLFNTMIIVILMTLKMWKMFHYYSLHYVYNIHTTVCIKKGYSQIFFLNMKFVPTVCVFDIVSKRNKCSFCITLDLQKQMIWFKKQQKERLICFNMIPNSQTFWKNIISRIIFSSDCTIFFYTVCILCSLYKLGVVWRNIILLLICHLIFGYGIILIKDNPFIDISVIHSYSDGRVPLEIMVCLV